MVPALIMMPAFITHVIPGLIMFPFLVVISIALVAVAIKCRIHLPEVNQLSGKLRARSLTTVGCIITRVAYRQVVMFVCVASVQCAFSYMMMFYAAQEGTLTASSGSWWDIVVVDFNARSMVCSFLQIQESAVSSWNLVYSQFV